VLALTPQLKTYFYAIRAYDDAGNPGPISNVLLIDGPDEDEDGVVDADETGCGADHLNPTLRPERLDGQFAGVDDDGDTIVDEPLPALSAAFDCDGDGYTGAAENHVYAPATVGDQDSCGTNSFPATNPPTPIGWPSDLRGESAFSANKVNVSDLGSFIAPVRRLMTDLESSPANSRWDIVPGGGILPADINIVDMAALVVARTGYPPMLKGARAYNGPLCPWMP
jgi:hypothetical protein